MEPGYEALKLVSGWHILPFPLYVFNSTMFSPFFMYIAVAAATIPSVFGQNFTVNTPPSLVEGQPVLFSWAGGVAPYFPSIIPAPTAAALKTFPQQTTTSLTWNVDLAPGNVAIVSIQDSTGAVVQSDSITIAPGN
ncbi:hypothetical protein BDZ89DRAFT_1066346 [Hymenopellis radicata]|nr:hypothetical protein BDZ89DRAFT_1066346 [Hymenopellis radicata]